MNKLFEGATNTFKNNYKELQLVKKAEASRLRHDYEEAEIDKEIAAKEARRRLLQINSEIAEKNKTILENRSACINDAVVEYCDLFESYLTFQAAAWSRWRQAGCGGCDVDVTARKETQKQLTQLEDEVKRAFELLKPWFVVMRLEYQTILEEAQNKTSTLTNEDKTNFINNAFCGVDINPDDLIRKSNTPRQEQLLEIACAIYLIKRRCFPNSDDPRACLLLKFIDMLRIPNYI